ncbi:MAG: B12-binding domain-containing radical SAM protein [Spirochaetes bacterium]|nr:B12-binding domain-containing radical SAM protein [Spirochaetota bacterium]
MIKVAMVYPSRENVHMGEIMLYNPLALGYLARHTPDNYSLTLYDEYGGDVFDPDAVEADLVAVAAITPEITRAYHLGDRLKKRGITTIIGGAHVTALPEEALEHYTSVCVGEGEGPWKSFLGDFEKGKIKQTYFGPMDVPLDDLGIPRRDMCHPNYQFPSVLTSRGCPFSCSFCYLTVFKQRKYRTIPHDTVIEDFDAVKDSYAVILVDENFIGYSEEERNDRKALLEKMIRKNYKFVWGCQTTTTIASDPELMKLMYRAGCRAVFVGFEAIDEESLKLVRKNHNIGLDYGEIVRKLHDNNIAVIASTIIGLDSHDKDYPQKLIKALKKSKADFPRVFFTTAWPGTPFFDGLEKEGRASRNWDEVRKDVPSIQFKHFTREEAIAARKEILDEFFNVLNIIRMLMRWVFKDRSLIKLYLNMVVGYRIRDYKKKKREKAAMESAPA